MEQAARVAPDITLLLRKSAEGDKQAEEQLFQNVYSELKRLARYALANERADHSLDPTALVNEAFLRIPRERFGWQDRNHFYSVCARAMRRILVDHARAQAAQKRPDPRLRISDTDAQRLFIAVEEDPTRYIAIDAALDDLTRLDPKLAEIVELRFFGGMTEHEIAEFLDCSDRHVRREWRVARLWLHSQLKQASAKSG